MDTNADLADSVRAAVLTQFSRGELNLPIPPELIQPTAEPEKNGLRSWLARRAQAKANAALIARRGDVAVQFVDSIQRKLLPANADAVELICSSAVAVLHNEQLKRQIVSDFRTINELVRAFHEAASDLDGKEVHEEVVQQGLTRMKERFQEYLAEIGKPFGRLERRK